MFCQNKIKEMNKISTRRHLEESSIKFKRKEEIKQVENLLGNRTQKGSDLNDKV